MTSYPFISVQEQENLSPSALLLFLESFLITKATVTPYSLTTYSLSEMCLLKISWACVVLNPEYPPDGCFTEVAASSRVDVKSCRAGAERLTGGICSMLCLEDRWVFTLPVLPETQQCPQQSSTNFWFKSQQQLFTAIFLFVVPTKMAKRITP